MSVAPVAGLDLATLLIRVISPIFVFFAALSLFFAQPTLPSSPSSITPVVIVAKVPRRGFILLCLSLVSLTFLLDGLTFVVYAVIDKHWPLDSGIEYNTVAGVAGFAGLAALGAWKDVQGVEVWTLRRLKVVVSAALTMDIALVALLVITFRAEHNGHPHLPRGSFGLAIPSLLHLAFPAIRVLFLISLLVCLSIPRIIYTPAQFDEIDEPAHTPSSFLLPPESGVHTSTGLSTVSGLANDTTKYGTFRTTRSNLQRSAPVTRAATPAPSSNGPDSKPDSKPEISLDPSWGEIWRRIRNLSPYLWPGKSTYLQMLAALCIFILLLGRVVNLAMPLTLGELVRILEGRSHRSPWPFLFGYVAIRFLQGSGGLAAIRDSLWAPVMQYSDREMSQLSFDHLLNLSFAWHTRRKTGEILRVLDRGAAINHTFELILFNILPTFIDIAVALVAFCILFEWVLGLVIFLVMFAYVAASVILTSWRTKLRRRMNDRDVVTRGIHTDCLLNYETVKYFGGEEYEGARYREAVRQYQALEYRVIVSLNLLNLVQNFIITLGLLIGCLLVAYRITQGLSEASQFVIFITYLTQLYGPLNQLGYIYRSVNQSLVDTEKLLALLNEPTEVNDKPNAPDLIVHDGEIEFENVSFSYDGRTTALDGVSFRVPKGSSVALVGESGSGKSTILRLLYRFYDLGEGEGQILIDGQDIKDVTQKSLRQAIGVVPQDSVLFNSSIGYNIGYGKFGASSDEIEAAAKSAQMHERILTFPDGYDTKVGERGVRLSGGEKQRVAIARTLLKNPPILLLDEATSALDTSTEKDIQNALQNLVKGRSSLSIAHRLSTIATADIILVLKDGRIVEQGNHKELMDLHGVFASMWQDQISANKIVGPLLDEESISKEPYGEGLIAEQASGNPLVSDTPEAILYMDMADSIDPKVDSQSGANPNENVNDTEAPSSGPVTFPSAPHDRETTTEEVPTHGSDPVFEAPATSIVSSTQISDPFKFPTSEPEVERQPDRATPAPGVTFGNIDAISRTGTPDPESEPKRKRISSQNFQRLARKISISTRRQSSSSIIPGLKRDQSPKISAEEGSVRGESSMQGSVDSPASSVKGDDKGKSKKEKKEKKEKKNRKGYL